jgi:hypothetical protein
MIALSPPLPGWIDEEAEHVLVMAVDRSVAVCVNETGHIWVRGLGQIQVDVRYAAQEDQWIVVSPGFGDAEEETDDGGPEISGRFSDTDGERDGDPGDEGN